MGGGWGGGRGKEAGKKPFVKRIHRELVQNPDEKCSLYLKVEVFRPVTLTLLCCDDNAPGSERNAPGIAQNPARVRP